MTIPCFLFILLIPLFSLALSTNDSELNKIEFSLCKKLGYKCGNQSYDIYYPFWIDESPPPYCAHPGFELSCTSVHNSLVINIGDKDYKVNHINYTHHLLSVTDISFADHDKSQLCDYIIRYTSINHFPFSYSTNDAKLTIPIDCPPNLSLPYHNIGSITCPGRGSHLKAYYNLSSDVQDDIQKKCKSLAILPICQTSVVNLTNSVMEDLMAVLSKGFELSWELNDVNDVMCSRCMDSNGTCYTDGSVSNDGSCVQNEKKRSLKVVMEIVAIVGGLFLLGTCIVLFLCALRKKRLNTNSSILSLKMDPDAGETNYNTHIFTYDELEEATHGFHESKKLGRGGFGTVYKGKLRDGRTVAVKRLYENNCCLDQFLNEIKILSRLRHQNLVTLYGCTSRHSRELLLVYEYIPNGTVADHLHGSLASKGGLPWSIRMSISIQTAEALSYLHSIEPQIIHRDIKTTNILLDNNFQVKVADFGISRLFPLDATHVSTVPQGTFGYFDPEYFLKFRLTDKSDVYSFGMLLLELISSKQAVDTRRDTEEINLANMAMAKIQTHRIVEFVDPDLGYESDLEARKMIDQVVELTVRCLQSSGEMRPDIKEVLRALRCIKDKVDGDVMDSQVTEESKFLRKAWRDN